MIRFFGAGRSTLAQGSVLRILAITENVDRKENNVKPLAILIGEESQYKIPLSLQTTLEDEAGVHPKSFIAEFETANLAAGAYELRLVLPGGQATLDELVWILTEAQYENLLKEEATDPSMTALFPESAPDRHKAERLVEEALLTKLTGFLRIGNILIQAPKLSISIEQVPRFSLGVIVYLAEVFADSCRDLLLHGAGKYALSVVFDERLYRFGLQFCPDELTQVQAASVEHRDWEILASVLKAEHSDVELTASASALRGGGKFDS